MSDGMSDPDDEPVASDFAGRWHVSICTKGQRMGAHTMSGRRQDTNDVGVPLTDFRGTSAPKPQPEQWWQRVAREQVDTRLRALELARADRDPMETPEQTVARAERYLQFLCGEAK